MEGCPKEWKTGWLCLVDSVWLVMFGRLCLIIFVYRWLLSYLVVWFMFGLVCLFKVGLFCSYWFLVGLFSDSWVPSRYERDRDSWGHPDSRAPNHRAPNQHSTSRNLYIDTKKWLGFWTCIYLRLQIWRHLPLVFGGCRYIPQTLHLATPSLTARPSRCPPSRAAARRRPNSPRCLFGLLVSGNGTFAIKQFVHRWNCCSRYHGVFFPL